MIQWLNDKIAEVEDLAQNAATAVVVVLALMTYYKTRALVPTILQLGVGGVLLWSIHHLDWWTTRVDEESGAPGAVVELVVTDPLPGPWSAVEVVGGGVV